MPKGKPDHDEPVPARLCDMIRDARKGKGLSQEALAEALGTRQSTVSGWERDETSPTSMTDARKLADVLDLDFGAIADACADYERRYKAGKTNRRTTGKA